MALKKSKLKKKTTSKSPKKRIIKRKTAPKKALKRKPVKKTVRPKKAKPAAPKTAKNKNIIGTITHYFPKVRAAVIKLKGPLSIGEKIKFKGHTTDFTQTVSSMQIDRVSINSAKKGDEIGLLVDSRVRPRDLVHKVS